MQVNTQLLKHDKCGSNSPHLFQLAESQRGVALLCQPALTDHYSTVMLWPGGRVGACRVSNVHHLRAWMFNLNHSSCFAVKTGNLKRPFRTASPPVARKHIHILSVLKTHLRVSFTYSPGTSLQSERKIKETLISQPLALNISEARAANHMKPLRRKREDDSIRQQRYNPCHSY